MIGGGHGGLEFTKENQPWPGPQDCAQLRPGLAVIGGGHGSLEFTKENQPYQVCC